VHGCKVYSTRILYFWCTDTKYTVHGFCTLVHGYKVYSTWILYFWCTDTKYTVTVLLSARIQGIQYMDIVLLSARIHSIQYTDTALQCTDTKYTIHGYCTVLLSAPERNTQHRNTIYYKCIKCKKIQRLVSILTPAYPPPQREPDQEVEGLETLNPKP
jgi:hypothetical protein